MENKKGIQLSQAFGAVLAIVLVGVLVIVAIVLFVNLKGVETATPQFENNQTLSPNVTEVGSAVSNASACDFSAFVVVNATNNSGGEIINSANYTVTSNGNVAFTGATTGYNNTVWDVSYTYTEGGSTCEASEDLIVQFATYPALIGLVGTVIFLGIVIGVLVGSFAFGGRRL